MVIRGHRFNIDPILHGTGGWHEPGLDRAECEANEGDSKFWILRS